MTAGRTIDDDLAASMVNTLLPPRFPARRDVEVEAAIRPHPTAHAYYDYFWRGTQTILFCAIRVHRTGLAGAQAACGMRSLLRALADRIDTPADILAGLRQRMDDVSFDAAVVELDIGSGAMRQAMHGQAQVQRVGSAKDLCEEALGESGIIWITAGPVRPLDGGHLPDEGLVSLVRPAMQASEGGAGIAVVLKTRSARKKGVTFAIANDLEAIPPLLNDIYRFLHQQSIAEEAVHGLDIALDEVLTNIVNYGYRDGRSHEVVVELSLAPDLLTIEVRDDGSPFDPLGVPEPDLSADLEDRHVGGLGMHFVRSLLDRLAYKRSNGWNVLTLEKRLAEGA